MLRPSPVAGPPPCSSPRGLSPPSTQGPGSGPAGPAGQALKSPRGPTKPTKERAAVGEGKQAGGGRGGEGTHRPGRAGVQAGELGPHWGWAVLGVGELWVGAALSCERQTRSPSAGLRRLSVKTLPAAEQSVLPVSAGNGEPGGRTGCDQVLGASVSGTCPHIPEEGGMYPWMWPVLHLSRGLWPHIWPRKCPIWGGHGAGARVQKTALSARVRALRRRGGHRQHRVLACMGPACTGLLGPGGRKDLLEGMVLESPGRVTGGWGGPSAWPPPRVPAPPPPRGCSCLPRKPDEAGGADTGPRLFQVFRLHSKLGKPIPAIEPVPGGSRLTADRPPAASDSPSKPAQARRPAARKASSVGTCLRATASHPRPDSRLTLGFQGGACPVNLCACSPGSGGRAGTGEAGGLWAPWWQCLSHPSTAVDRAGSNELGGSQEVKGGSSLSHHSPASPGWGRSRCGLRHGGSLVAPTERVTRVACDALAQLTASPRCLVRPP